MNKYALGIDLGGTGTKFGLVNNDGNVLRTLWRKKDSPKPDIESWIRYAKR